jgi:hypothetical protein
LSREEASAAHAPGLTGAGETRQCRRIMRHQVGRLVAVILAFVLAFLGALSPAPAQNTLPEPGKTILRLAAVLGDASAPLQAGLHWRLFNERTESDGSHALVAESAAPQPAIAAPPGDYVVHVAFGLASATKHITLGDDAKTERLTLNAGALRITGTRGDAQIDPNRLSLAIYVPDRNNPQAKLVYSKAKAGDLLGLPEGAYHIVSTFLDTTVGTTRSATAPSNPLETNSIVSADIKVPSGKVLDVTLRHRYATLTLKLVNAAGADAMANTNFTILTPGGDLIRELIGAFPSLVLAEGEYVVIARHDAKTYQSTFQVQSGLDRDVEVIAQ